MLARSLWLARRVGLLGAFVLILQLGQSAASVEAHAILLRSDPADSASLAEAPGQVRLWFSEALAGGLATVQLLDTHGVSVPVVQPRFDASESGLLIVDLPRVGVGAYTLNWTVVSENGGHPARGSVVFAVGSAPPVSSNRGAAFGLTALEGPLVGLLLAGLVGLLGGLVLNSLVLKPAFTEPRLRSEDRHALLRAERRVSTFTATCAIAAFVAGLLWLLWQLMSIANAAVDALGTAWLLLAHTRAGGLWLLRQALLTGLAIHCLREARLKRASRRSEFLVSVAAVSLACIQAFGSHAASADVNGPVALVADAAHVLAAGAWVGGLLALTVGVLPVLPRESAALALVTGAVWSRFSRVAALAVGILVATGGYAAGQQVVSAEALTQSEYGRLVLGKIVLVIAAGAAGLFVSAVVHPRPLARVIQTLRALEPRRLSKSVDAVPKFTRLEACFGLAIVLLAGLLASAVPPRVVTDMFSPRPAFMSQVVGDLVVAMEVRPNRVGPNVVFLRVASQRRPAPAGFEQVVVRLLPPGGQDMLTAQAEEQAPGVFRVLGEELDTGGAWRADIVVSRSAQPELTASFDWVVGSSPLSAEPAAGVRAALNPREGAAR